MGCQTTEIIRAQSTLKSACNF